MQRMQRWHAWGMRVLLGTDKAQPKHHVCFSSLQVHCWYKAAYGRKLHSAMLVVRKKLVAVRKKQSSRMRRVECTA